MLTLSYKRTIPTGLSVVNDLLVSEIRIIPVRNKCF